MTTYHDHRWHGPADAMTAALDSLPPPLVQVGPRVLDGTAYLLRRDAGPVPVPDGLAPTGSELSVSLLGIVADRPAA